MPTVVLAHCLDFVTWRNATRTLILHDVAAEEITWRIRDPADTATPVGLTPPLRVDAQARATFGVPRTLMRLVEDVMQTGAPDRLDLAYRLVLRQVRGTTPSHAEDADGTRARHLAQEACEQTRAFRAHVAASDTPADALRWDRPGGFVAQCNARFVTLQFSFHPWRMELQDNMMQWDGTSLHLGAPLQDADPASFPSPALPLVEGMDIDRITALPAVAETARSCLVCAMAHHATQTVFGEGEATAPLMFVGEQPGDQEDRIGRPFVGPAGQLFDRALQEAGIARDHVYVTNTVKHFKFFNRNGRRIHQKAGVEEIRACAPWLQAERRLIRPRLLVMLGATAASAILQRPVVIGRERSRPVTLDDGTCGLVTVHPSFLLRQPTEEARTREYQRFVEDLRLAGRLIAA
ncbi:uracil-DNA glycosylase [Novacetimonas maltaceti]|uniref:Type-4 uracil-DNA glycosylase n=1 Tax=Novacetimonas maltaceti TaxID=1203393 RepID=A0A2S3W291_9PROT|nr:UdgX family uracil-DNA binding protein [Novacetimonas maltaceti]POF62947.1 Uracil DNA glycosylase superfamily protein [Novacetimonas maltaceti]PYD61792.1 uracil-DNA glycosylase [Novacetimonas maltaceti]